MAMFPYELADILFHEVNKKKYRQGIDCSCFFRDKKGKLHEFDYVQFDKKGNLIVSKNENNEE